MGGSCVDDGSRWCLGLWIGVVPWLAFCNELDAKLISNMMYTVELYSF